MKWIRFASGRRMGVFLANWVLFSPQKTQVLGNRPITTNACKIIFKDFYQHFFKTNYTHLFGTVTILSNMWKMPLVFFNSPESAEIKVDLPLAIPPTIPTKSPLCIAIDMLDKDVFSCVEHIESNKKEKEKTNIFPKLNFSWWKLSKFFAIRCCRQSIFSRMVVLAEFLQLTGEKNQLFLHQNTLNLANK